MVMINGIGNDKVFLLMVGNGHGMVKGMVNGVVKVWLKPKVMVMVWLMVNDDGND